MGYSIPLDVRSATTALNLTSNNLFISCLNEAKTKQALINIIISFGSISLRPNRGMIRKPVEGRNDHIRIHYILALHTALPLSVMVRIIIILPSEPHNRIQLGYVHSLAMLARSKT